MPTTGPEAANRPGSITFLLGGLILVVTTVTLSIFLVPIVDCPGPGHHSIGAVYGDCPRCGKERGATQRMTLWRWWFWRPTPQERDQYEAECRPIESIEFHLDPEPGKK